MSKNLLQDMVKTKTSVTKKREEVFIKQTDKRKSKFGIYFVAFISVIFLLFALSFLFSGAKITLLPKINEINLKNEILSASKDGDDSSLPFELVILSGSEEKEVQGSEEKDVTEKAIGNVIIYNSFSSSPQTFDINTKLEGSNGKIYQTNKKVIVPGKTKDNKPGSVEVTISAKEAGEEYNSSPIDFRIFGFKGTSKYSKFYARSKTEIKGGIRGKSNVISSLDKITLTEELKSNLKNKLSNQIKEQIPDGFVLFKNAIIFDVRDNDVVFSSLENQNIKISIKGTLYGFLFNEKKLTKKIAESFIDKYDGNDIYIPNIKDLEFSFNNKNEIFAETKDISFTVSGFIKVVSRIDEKKFITDVLGKKKKDFNKILTEYKNIESAEIVIRPFWKNYFPEKIENIELIINYPDGAMSYR